MTVERKPTVMGAVLGSYRITGALGGGGMGAVYAAKHTTTGRPAAIKLLRKELSENEELVQRFFNEARAATRIRHPGIIEVYDFGFAEDGLAYLAMELLEGVTLRHRLTQLTVLPEAEAVRIARAVAEALGAAHAAGIIHRDLKPDNIFLVGGTAPKVLDFGIAKLLDRGAPTEASRTRTGSLIGTPVYMSPEQARAAGAIDPRADLYSLGCILHELLSGAPPFTGTLGELLAAHMFTEPPALTMVSPPLAALVRALLAKDPADRPRDAAAVVAALSPRTAHGMFSDRPPQLVAAKRSAMPIIAAVATIAIAATALGLVFLRGGDGEPRDVQPVPAAIVAPAATPPPAPAAPVIATRPAQAAPPQPAPPVPVAPRHVDEHRAHREPASAKVPPSTGPVTTPEPRHDPPALVTPQGAPLGAEP